MGNSDKVELEERGNSDRINSNGRGLLESADKQIPRAQERFSQFYCLRL